MIEYKELKKANGDVFFEARRTPDNNYIYLNWIGIQSLETIVMGGNHVLTMLREQPCRGILNSNREIIGPWEVAVNWLTHKWAPQAKELGVQYFAHVLSPGIYGQRSFSSLSPNFEQQFKLRSFDNEEAAKEWLISKHD